MSPSALSASTITSIYSYQYLLIFFATASISHSPAPPVNTYSEADYSHCSDHLTCSYNSTIAEHNPPSPINIYLCQVSTFPCTSAVRLKLIHTGTPIKCSALTTVDTAQEVSKPPYLHYPTFAPFHPVTI